MDKVETNIFKWESKTFSILNANNFKEILSLNYKKKC